MNPRFPAKLFGLLILLPLPASGQADPGSIDLNFREWQDAAETGRADVLILSDSVTFFAGTGWDAGIQRALADRYGLAGTGVLSGRNSAIGETYSMGGVGDPNWNLNQPAGPAAALAPLDVLSARTNPATARLDIQQNSLLDLSNGGTLDVWASGAGSFSVDRRTPPNSSTDPGGQAPTLYDVPVSPDQPIEATIDPAPTWAEIGINDATFTDLLGYRLRTHTTGVTVTSYGLGGRSTLDHYQEFYEPLTTAQRTQFYDMLTHGSDSGKLAIFLLQGFNDLNERDPSLGLGIDPGDSPIAFADNTRFYIDELSDAWEDAGRDPADLSFVVSGMYPIAGDIENQELPQFADALAAFASVDDRVSYIDPWAGLDFDDVAEFLDEGGLHPTANGSYALGERLVQALVPSTIPGDYSGNGRVEQADLDLLLNNWGQLRTGFQNADGFNTSLVDQEELDRVLNNWGSSQAPDFTGTNLPEPMGLTACAMGAALLVRRRGWRMVR